MADITIRTETIRLSQFLKLANLVQDGLEAKLHIQNGDVRVNGKIDKRRGKKLKDGDRIDFAGNTLYVRQK